MDVAEELFTVKKENDDSYHEYLFEMEKVKEELPETIFVKCEAYNENYTGETDCAHHEDIKLEITKEASEKCTLDSVYCQKTSGTYEDVKPKLENDCDSQVSVLRLTDTEVKTLLNSSNYSAVVDSDGSETKQIKTENDESTEKEANLDSYLSEEDEDSASKKFEKDIGTGFCRPIQVNGTHAAFQYKVSFSEKTSLIRHERLLIDTETEKSVHCKICFKSFSTRRSLIRHGRLHAEKTFKCEICSKYFSDRSNLIRHERIHGEEKPFQCEICFKSFSEKGTLVRHEKIHTGKKLLRCEICSKHFSERGSLNRHQKIHAGEKLFHCETCSRSFSQKSSLTRHQKIHAK